MTKDTKKPPKPDQPSPQALARRYLDLWEENLVLCAREGDVGPDTTVLPTSAPP